MQTTARTQLSFRSNFLLKSSQTNSNEISFPQKVKFFHNMKPTLTNCIECKLTFNISINRTLYTFTLKTTQRSHLKVESTLLAEVTGPYNPKRKTQIPRGWPSGQGLRLRVCSLLEVSDSKPLRCYQSIQIFALTLIGTPAIGQWDWCPRLVEVHKSWPDT